MDKTKEQYKGNLEDAASIITESESESIRDKNRRIKYNGAKLAGVQLTD